MVDDFSKYASKRFYKLDDVQDRPRRETIADCSEGQYGKPVLTFKSGRRFSLNATNIDIMREAFAVRRRDQVQRRRQEHRLDPADLAIAPTRRAQQTSAGGAAAAAAEAEAGSERAADR